VIKAIAIDDECNALGIIENYCTQSNAITLLASFQDPEQAIEFVKNHPVDLVFLDVQLSAVNGLSLIPRLAGEPKIVLTTAHPDYALQGYDLDILDYLLKPFAFARFERALQKYQLITAVKNTNPTSQAKTLVAGADDIIFVKSDHKTHKVRLDELKWIEGAGNYVTLHTIRQKILTLQNLRSFETFLQPYQFIRVHKSFIVNVKYVDSIDTQSIHCAGQQIPIGETYKEKVLLFLRELGQHF
jgi:two-component system, LytTR family, response regulator